ncbi:hypothetical protein LNP25_32395 [Klebsiella variicola subsp. variicola]|nr:hypothetical protein [Klebsiella variicola subsp. variicola]
MRKGDKIKVMSTGQVYNADRLGIFTPKQVDRTGAEMRRGRLAGLRDQRHPRRAGGRYPDRGA